MSYLAKAKKPNTKPPMITIVGSPGAGKTTLGALFPKCILLPTEDGTATFENWDEDLQPTVLPRLPKARKDALGKLEKRPSEVLSEILTELMTQEHDFKTLVIDSVTTLHKLFEHEITLRDDVATAADASGGFHKGLMEVAQWHADFIYKCEQLRILKGMAIVFLAHTGIKKIRNSPDAVADYSVFSMEMDNQSASIYTSQSDSVIYLTKEQFVSGAETDKKGRLTKYGRISETGSRKLITSGNGQVGYINAKNRYGMPTEIPCEHGTNPLIPFIKFYNTEK